MKVVLGKLKLIHATKKYLAWLNDSDVTKFTNQIFIKHSINSIKKYIQDNNKSKESFLYGIFIFDNKKKIHIGNIKISKIDIYFKTAMISLLIGEKKFWGKNIGTKAVKLIIKLAIQKKLYKLYAGCYAENISSKKVFIKNNFKKEGVQKKQVIYNNNRTDLVWYGLIL